MLANRLLSTLKSFGTIIRFGRHIASVSVSDPDKFGTLDPNFVPLNPDNSSYLRNDAIEPNLERRPADSSVYSYEAKIKKRIEREKNNQALAMFNQMIHIDRIVPTEYTYRTLISGLCDLITNRHLIRMVNRLELHSNRLRPIHLKIFTLLYKSIHRCPSRTLALSYFNDLNDFINQERALGNLHRLNEFVYNAKLGAMVHLNFGPNECMHLILNELLPDGCYPEIDAMNYLLIACSNEAKRSKVSFSNLVIETSQYFYNQFNIMPNTQTFNIILRSMRHDPVWVKSKKDPELISEPTESSYLPMAQAISALSTNNINPSYYLSIMELSGAKANLQTLHLLLQIIPVDDTNAEAELENSARTQGIVLDTDWYNTKILRAIMSKNQVEERVKSILVEMTDASLEINFGTIKALANDCCSLEKAKELIEKMMDLGFMDCHDSDIARVSAIFQVFAQKAVEAGQLDYCEFVLTQAGDRFMNWWILNSMREFLEGKRQEIVEKEHSGKPSASMVEEALKFHDLWRLFNGCQETLRRRRLLFR